MATPTRIAAMNLCSVAVSSSACHHLASGAAGLSARMPSPRLVIGALLGPSSYLVSATICSSTDINLGEFHDLEPASAPRLRS